MKQTLLLVGRFRIHAVVGIGVGSLVLHHARLLTGLRGVFRARGDFFTVVFFVMVDFFVVGDIAGIGHGWLSSVVSVQDGAC